jgi:putative addiction module component (TIGR02574 family)
MSNFDFSALSPIERIELADLLYDSAMQQIDAAQLRPDQLAELDRRIADVQTTRVELEPLEAAWPKRRP